MGVGLRVAMLGEWRHVAAVAILVLAFAPWSMLWPASVAAEPYLVQPGDTLSGIAAAYGVPLDDLATANDITELDVLFAGDVLFVPEYGVATVPVGYTVREGDTLEEVAALLGTSLPRLLAANPAIVDPDSIAVGQTLRVPGFGDDDVVLPRHPRSEVAALLIEYARLYDLDPAFVLAVAWQESSWRQDALSPAGASGVMQLLPDTGDWVADELVGVPLDVTGSAADNILAGVAYLAWLLDRTGDDWLALALYVQGEGSVARNGVFFETAVYADNVLLVRDVIARTGAPPAP